MYTAGMIPYTIPTRWSYIPLTKLQYLISPKWILVLGFYFTCCSRKTNQSLPSQSRKNFSHHRNHTSFQHNYKHRKLLALLFSRYNCNGTYQHLLKENQHIFIRDILQCLTWPRNIWVWRRWIPICCIGFFFLLLYPHTGEPFKLINKI